MSSSEEREEAGPSKLSSSSGEEESEYEVDKIIGMRMYKGKRSFRVRWKGFGEGDDTWEDEDNLKDAQFAVEAYYAAEQEKKDKGKNGHNTKKDSKKRGRPSKSEKKAEETKAKSEQEEDEEDSGEESGKEYEVQRIIDVKYYKNKAKYLVHWKGFSSAHDSWEPAENLSCPLLMEEFQKKLEKAKSAPQKELRENRKQTQRLKLDMHSHERKMSKRSKKAVNYTDLD